MNYQLNIIYKKRYNPEWGIGHGGLGMERILLEYNAHQKSSVFNYIAHCPLPNAHCPIPTQS
ncbi:hypothetical protein H6G81_27205 [Scytonema hofmannii FACHB-248]|uniref:Aminoacyl-tRNA synthetase class II (D/K/N) domain-containing protein n=1 Tax=Scytonema hofmannii FACHB-248 TaxID=1842502 RepID=A0ABR8GXH7_9CYAN|nr:MULTISPECIES: hypothetical protein [Nostocales]MBD2608103.1 hypothetical protein [Scytonema hofmannii FACHB-248]